MFRATRLMTILASAFLAAAASAAPGAPHAHAIDLPLYFLPGDADAPGTFVASGGGGKATFDEDGLTLLWLEQEEGMRRADRPHGLDIARFERVAANPVVNVAHVRFVGGGSKPRAGELTGTIFNVMHGDPATWRVGIEAAGSVVYDSPWPGTTLTYDGKGGTLKYTLVVEPGAGLESIALECPEANSASVLADGTLRIEAPFGPIDQGAPIAWQVKDGVEVPVAVAFKVLGGSPARWGYSVGAHDPSLDLIIDPPQFIHAGFLGGPGDDRGLGIDVDASGAAHVTGGMQRATAPFDDDVFVAKVAPAGNALAWMSVFGGGANDQAFDIDVDAAGNSYVTGATASSNFPVAVGPDLTYNGYIEGFVTKLAPNGMQLVYSGYIGGSGLDFGERVVADAAGYAHVHGPTSSNENTFPIMVGPDKTYNGGVYDAFVAKIKPVPSSTTVSRNYAFCGYIGGAGSDIDNSFGYVTSGHIALDGSGNVYVSGATESNEATFPAGRGFRRLPGFDQTQNGDYDAFAVKVKSSGRGLEYATYVGGNGYDSGFGMAVDSTGHAHFTGLTDSLDTTFPVHVGPDLTFNGAPGADGDTFVVKIASDGQALDYCGYIGGNDVDGGYAVALAPSGALIVTGYTQSNEATFPVVGGPDLTFNDTAPNLGDCFIARIVPNPTSANPLANMEYCGYIGGADYDQGYWVALDGAGNAYLTGDTWSDETTFPDGDGIGALASSGPAAHGGVDAFVVKIAP